jgi:hypothetical protein
MAALPPIVRMDFIKQVGGTWSITKKRRGWFETNNPAFYMVYSKVDFDPFAAIQWLESHGWLVTTETSPFGLLREFSAQYIGQSNNPQSVSVPEQLTLGLSA